MLAGTSVTDGGSYTRVLKIEMFDSERNEWTEVSQIPVERFESEEEINKGKRFKACSASFSKKVINKRKQLDYKLKPNSNTSTFILVCFLFMV